MNAPLDGMWTIIAGDGSQVTLVALPSAVDRSVRLAASPQSGISACQPLGRTAETVIVEYATDPAASATVGVAGEHPWTLPLRSRNGSESSDDGLGWYRLDLDLRSGEWTVRRSAEASSTTIASGRASRWEPFAGAPATGICFALEGGSEAALLIDSIEVH